MTTGNPPTPQGGAATPVQRPGSPARAPHRTWGERLLLTFGVIATTLTVLAASVLAWGLSQFEAIESIDIANVDQAPPGEPANWLLVGTDSREGIDASDPNAGVFIGGDPSELPSGKRTDTMIIARVNPKGQAIDLLSIPRDLYVPIAGTGGEGRINAAFNAENGEQRLVDTIESYFGFQINHYAEVNFVGFQDIVDELGGVSIWFDKPMRDSNSGLNIQNAGCHRLGGFDALAFARSRKLEFFEDGSWQTDPTGDLGRTSRQQYFLRRVVDTAAAQIDLTSLGKISSLVKVGGKNLVIDRSVEPGDLLELAKTFADLRGDQIVGHAIPVIDFRTADGAAVLGMQVEEAQPILDIFRGIAPPAAALAATTTTEAIVRSASVFNASGVDGIAGTVSTSLDGLGFDVAEPGNAQARAQTLVRYPSSQATGAAELISYLATDPQIEVDENVESVVLIIGADFAGLAQTQRAVVPLAAASVAVDQTTPATTVPEAAPSTTEAIGVVPEETPEGTACY